MRLACRLPARETPHDLAVPGLVLQWFQRTVPEYRAPLCIRIHKQANAGQMSGAARAWLGVIGLRHGSDCNRIGPLSGSGHMVALLGLAATVQMLVLTSKPRMIVPLIYRELKQSLL